MFGGFPGMGGQQQQGGGGMDMNAMMGGMMGMMGGMGGGQPQQQQQQGGMNPMGMMGGMMGGFGMGGGQGQQQNPDDHGAFNNLFSDRNPNAAPPALFPGSASTFRCKVQIEAGMMPGLVMSGTMAYDLSKSRCRTDWGAEYGPEAAGWEIENHQQGWKVRKEGGPDSEQTPKATEINPEKDQFPVYAVPPFATFQGTAVVGGKLCYRYYFDFMGMLAGTLYVSVPVAVPESEDASSANKGLEQVSVPVLSDMTMMGMIKVRMYMSEHELVEGFDDALFDVTKYTPPRGVPGVVRGFVRDSTNFNLVPGVKVSFVPATGQATTDDMTATTDDRGTFQVNIPPCEYNVTYSKDGYSELTKGINVTGPIAGGTFADGFLSPILEEGQMRFVLRWFASPRDLDLHAHKNDSSIICYYGMRNGSSAKLNVDVTTSYGPETITVPNTNVEDDDAINIWVYQYSAYGRLAGCGATIDMYDHTGHFNNVVIPNEAEDPLARWWKVARVANGKCEIINVVDGKYRT